jgi:hypothetical protein
LRPRRGRAFIIQQSHDVELRAAERDELEDASDDRGLGVVDGVLDVGRIRMPLLAGGPSHAQTAGHHIDQVVAVAPTTGDMARARLAEALVVRALPVLVTRELRAKRLERRHRLLHRRIERALAVLEVVEDADAGAHDLLQ